MKTANYKGYTIYEDGRVLGLKGYFLKPGLSSNGYFTVCICTKEKKTSVPIHRLIAESFIPNPENKIYINHKNSIRTDNSIDNLEWCTPKENACHMVKSGRINNTINSIRKRMSKRVIDSSNGEIYPSCTNAAKELGYKKSTLVNMLLGNRKNKTTLKYL